MGADRQIALFIAPCVIGLVSCSSDTQRPKDPSNCLRVVYNTGQGFAEIRAKRVRTISDRQFKAINTQTCGLPIALRSCSGEMTVSALTYTVSEAGCGPTSLAATLPETLPPVSQPEDAPTLSGPEEVVAQYFIALRANDSKTLTSFATVQFDQKVDDFKIVSVGPATRTPVTLPDLVGRRQLGVDFAQFARNARDVSEADIARNARDLAETEAAVEREKRLAIRSLGQIENVESLTGDVITKDVEINITVAGQAKPYVMTLRKYDVAGASGARLLSRWVVDGLSPKG